MAAYLIGNKCKKGRYLYSTTSYRCLVARDVSDFTAGGVHFVRQIIMFPVRSDGIMPRRWVTKS